MLLGSNLISLLIELVVGAIVVYAVYVFLSALTLPQPIRTIILLLIAVMAIIFLANLFGVKV